MARLDAFSVDDLVALSAEIRHLGDRASTMEEVAQRVVHYLYDCLTDRSGRPATALVRFYKTHGYGTLPADMRHFAYTAAAGRITDDTRCLTLLGSFGHVDQWRSPRKSKEHQAIPLTSTDAVAAMPMVSRLFEEMGLDTAYVVESPGPDIVLGLHHQHYDVFHVPNAAGSPWIPAQDFVADHGIRSAVGFGAMLPSGDLFATVLFATVAVDDRTADLLRSLAPAVKAAVVRYAFNVFT